MIDGPALAPASGNAPRQIVVLLHGYGSNGADLIALARHWQEALPETLFIAPDAPEPCPGNPGGFQWWGLSMIDRAALAAGALRAAPVVDEFIDQSLSAHRLADDRLALVGFSQGTMLALHVGPRRRRPLAGIIGYSGMIADGDRLKLDVRTRPPVLLIHGSADPMIPLSAFHETRSHLARLGFDVSTHVSPGLGHGVDAAGVQLGQKFLERVLVPRTRPSPPAVRD